MYNACPAVSSAWSRGSPPGTPWGLGPMGQPSGVTETRQVDAAPLGPPGSPHLEAPLRMLAGGYGSAVQRGRSSEPLALMTCLVGFVLCIQPDRGQGNLRWGAAGGEAAGRGRCELTASLPLGSGLQAFHLLSALPPFSRVSALPPEASHP